MVSLHSPAQAARVWHFGIRVATITGSVNGSDGKIGVASLILENGGELLVASA